MKTLPESFCIKRTEDPRWMKFIQFLLKKDGVALDGYSCTYYGSRNCRLYCGHTDLGNLITLDDFFACIEPEEEFKYGELVECRDTESDQWTKPLYYFAFVNSRHWVTHDGLSFLETTIVSYDIIRKPLIEPPRIITHAEIAKLIGTDNFKIEGE